MEGISYGITKDIKSWKFYIKGPVNGKDDVSQNPKFSVYSLGSWMFKPQTRTHIFSSLSDLL